MVAGGAAVATTTAAAAAGWLAEVAIIAVMDLVCL